MSLLRQLHGDENGTEMVEFVVGATLIITIMTLVMVAIWNTTNARANATNTIITETCRPPHNHKAEHPQGGHPRIRREVCDLKPQGAKRRGRLKQGMTSLNDALR